MQNKQTAATIRKQFGFAITETQSTIHTMLKEVDLTDDKNGLIDDQRLTERYRHRDTRAAVMTKNISALMTLHSAKFEEAKTKLSIKANADNMALKKADYKTAMLQALATDDTYVIATEQITDVKDTIDEINTAELSYTSDISTSISTIAEGEITL